MRRWGFLIIAALWAGTALAETVSVAIASNFLGTAEKLAKAFEAETGHQLLLSNGSTGLLFAQISAGAPFEVFLSADEARPDRLLENGIAKDVRLYAIGQLALVSNQPVTAQTAGEVFAGKTAALADPTVAPYGQASTRAMEKLSLDTASFRPVVVANVGQAASIFVTGNADLAFVSSAQLPKIDAPHALDLTGIAPDILQAAALLSDAPSAVAFWDWLETDTARSVIATSGYRLP